MSHLSDVEDGPGGNVQNMRMKNMGGQGGQQGGGDNSGLIRDILTAFVGVVNAQGQQRQPQVPVYLPPQYMAQFAAAGMIPPGTVPGAVPAAAPVAAGAVPAAVPSAVPAAPQVTVQPPPAPAAPAVHM